eukprot:TRINITY_DN1357_c1_g1_i2.p1 TRINITY_DN1357_c1_g1~~TRINITY_DN1357_c1_g1_i2.p1  ORF type:complete len:165 (-),score=9.59 TRINITY_DN1357_c1_g1_i2:46-540(-)
MPFAVTPITDCPHVVPCMQAAQAAAQQLPLTQEGRNSTTNTSTSTTEPGASSSLSTAPHPIPAPQPSAAADQMILSPPCATCKDVSENWVCLACGGIYCSRYVQGHMSEHNEANRSHHIGISFSDLSVWCYTCDSYIKDGRLSPLLRAMHLAKFGEALPENAEG